MEISVVGIYKSQADAQSAMNELLQCGFSQGDVQFSGSDKSESGSIGRSLKEESGVGDFFRNLFGREDTQSHAQSYEHAAGQGNCVLTVHAASEEMAHRAAEVMERFGPIDVDEYGSGAGIGSGTRSGIGATSTMASNASAEGRDDVQKGRTKSAQAASYSGPSTESAPTTGSRMGSSTSGSMDTSATSSGMQDDVQKGRSQSTDAAAAAGPSGTRLAGSGESSTSARRPTSPSGSDLASTSSSSMSSASGTASTTGDIVRACIAAVR